MRGAVDFKITQAVSIRSNTRLVYYAMA